MEVASRSARPGTVTFGNAGAALSEFVNVAVPTASATWCSGWFGAVLGLARTVARTAICALRKRIGLSASSRACIVMASVPSAARLAAVAAKASTGTTSILPSSGRACSSALSTNGSLSTGAGGSLPRT